jgi:hypothetical protein
VVAYCSYLTCPQCVPPGNWAYLSNRSEEVGIARTRGSSNLAIVPQSNSNSFSVLIVVG